MVEKVIFRNEYFNIIINKRAIAIRLLLFHKQSRLLETDPESKPKQNTGLSVTEI